jgi:hypothetical protein
MSVNVAHLETTGRDDLIITQHRFVNHGCDPAGCSWVTIVYPGLSGTVDASVRIDLGLGLPYVAGPNAVAADFNGDGFPDFAVQIIGDGVHEDFLRIYYGDGMNVRRFSSHQDFPVGMGAGFTSMVGANFTGSGARDLAALGFNDFSQVDVFLNTTPAECQPPGTPGVAICQPLNHAEEGTSVRIKAAANVPNFTLLRIYDNNRNVYQTTSPTLDINLGLTPGINHLVVVAYDGATGQVYTADRIVNSSGSGASICTAPRTNQTIDICYPNENNNTGAVFELQAHARWDNSVITHMRVYVDDQPVYDEETPQDGYINPVLTVSGGTHHIVVVAWNTNGIAIASPPRTAIFFP